MGEMDAWMFPHSTHGAASEIEGRGRKWEWAGCDSPPLPLLAKAGFRAQHQRGPGYGAEQGGMRSEGTLRFRTRQGGGAAP